MIDLFSVFSKDWVRPMKEIDVQRVYKKDYGYMLCINIVGIPEERLLIGVEAGFLVINGNINLEDINFKNSVSYKISLAGIKVKKIDYSIKDGFLYVEIHEEKPASDDIVITKK
jgi:HSP20 family molecular chaperone IbpA